MPASSPLSSSCTSGTSSPSGGLSKSSYEHKSAIVTPPVCDLSNDSRRAIASCTGSSSPSQFYMNIQESASQYMVHQQAVAAAAGNVGLDCRVSESDERGHLIPPSSSSYSTEGVKSVNGSYIHEGGQKNILNSRPDIVSAPTPTHPLPYHDHHRHGLPFNNGQIHPFNSHLTQRSLSNQFLPLAYYHSAPTSEIDYLSCSALTIAPPHTEVTVPGAGDYYSKNVNVDSTAAANMANHQQQSAGHGRLHRLTHL